MNKIPLTYGPGLAPLPTKGPQAAAKPFGEILTKAIGEVDKMQNDAGKAIVKGAAGSHDCHGESEHCPPGHADRQKQGD